MITTDTFVFYEHKGEFIHIADCSISEIQNSLGRLEYLEGYISIQYYGTELAGAAYYDNIIPLWKNIIDGLSEYSENRNAIIFFPDNASTMTLRSVNHTQIVLGLNESHYALTEKEFFHALLISARKFFEWLGDDVYTKKSRQLEIVLVNLR
ncbi:hypothetical protein [Intestinimonas butyriciproducens]|uniref:hypothetical protein n=1 Tax=Intestinimonas butyriciproducens TaxID=1297617 RepID=UPI0019595916|nr:hypothetical protein [Intestinimonas butyriciproducens]MBM6976825.1 hypothetical protein [Intestinimonas butyriciproducens]